MLYGSEGIQSHYDDAGRFDRPIYSLRLLSDSRLSFGTQLYGCACSQCLQLSAGRGRTGASARARLVHAHGACTVASGQHRLSSGRHPGDIARYTNGAFYVDMPRGCITVMEAGGYAAAGLKHCVRPIDMAGEARPSAS